MSKSKPFIKDQASVEVQPQVVQPQVVQPQADPQNDGPEFCDGTDAEGFPGGDVRMGLHQETAQTLGVDQEHAKSAGFGALYGSGQTNLGPELAARLDPGVFLPEPCPFSLLCEEVSDRFGIDLVFRDDDRTTSAIVEPYEQDGNLIVPDNDGKFLAVFDVSFDRELSADHQNRNSSRVLKALGLGHLHNSRTKI